MSTFPSRYVNTAAARARFGDEVSRLAPFFFRSDDAADAVVEAISAMPRGEGFRMLERGLADGPSSIAAAPRVLREFLEEAASVPLWVDWDACDRGGALLMRAGVLGGAVLGTRSIVLAYASPAGNKPLVMSGRLKEQAFRRLNETSRFVQAVCRPGGMRPGADGFQITLKVRLMHAQVRRMILRTGTWSAAAWGLPINQHDMAATILLFSVVLVDGLRKLGMAIPDEEAESYMHLWRWVGQLIGVHDALLPLHERGARRLSELVATTMGEPDRDSRELTRALFDASRTAAVTLADRREAERRYVIGTTLCRELIGDELADKLGVERSTARHAVPLLKTLVRGASHIATRVPRLESSALSFGARYWDRVVEVGLASASYEFGLPDRLAHTHVEAGRHRR